MRQISSIGIDFKLPYTPHRSTKSSTKVHIALLLASLFLGLIVFIFITDSAEAKKSSYSPINRTTANLQLSPEEHVTIPLNIPPAPNIIEAETPTPTVTPSPTLQYHHVKVKKGDSLAQIFSKLGIPLQELQQILAINAETKSLPKLIPDQKFDFIISENNTLQELIFYKNTHTTIRVHRNTDNNFSAILEVKEYEMRTTYANGNITSSLFEAAQKAGLSETLTMEMANIFAWDIDFALDIRKNDHFAVLYEERFLDGKYIGDGKIVAAEFINQNKTYQAIRYTDSESNTSYYTPDGRSMRKAFLRTPVDFTRISSHFGKRYHPILNRMKAHKGVDYAAPRGTPIKAAGDGKIIFRGRKGGYGKTIVIQHGKKYSTLYAHMSKYAKNLATGKKVKQGQTIGYVGSTGRATGPHLHYEFRVNNSHRNPLTIRLAASPKIDPKYKDDFVNQVQGLLTQLDLFRRSETSLSSL